MFRKLQVLALLVILCENAVATDPEIEAEELRARDFLQLLNKKTEQNYNKMSLADWAYASNITETNLQNQLKVGADTAKERKANWQEVVKFNWKTFSDPDLKRQFKKYTKLGSDILPAEKLNRFNKILSEMQKVYSTAKICWRDKCGLGLEPELTHALANSRDAEELRHVWVEWRRAVGGNLKELFEEYVELANEAARLNNFTDNAQSWLESYEERGFKAQVEALWEQLRPLYLQIHAYVRLKLRARYGAEVVSEKGPIPAHLLGNMWAQKWRNVAAFTLPYPARPRADLTEELRRQNYTSEKIFRTAENFFTSINLTAMPESFWAKSILEKPADRDVVCHASAWDFYDGKDFRIKQCTQTTLEHFTTAHHEMGHVEYFLQYKNLPVIYRRGANPGFHEAVGDLISLSVESRKHLRKIGLLTSDDDPESILNNLYEIGLDKIVFLPFGYLMDLWRWGVFEGKITKADYNCKWWELREKYQGVEPPVNRTEDDFDPAAKYHIIAEVPYIRYFVSFVIQFQFHRAVCEKAGQYDPNDPSKPLHECDIYQNTNAGNALKNMLQLGSSRAWPDAIEVLTGQRTMDASALLEYFKPLQKWLEMENKKNGAFIGWEKSTKVCTKTPKPDVGP